VNTLFGRRDDIILQVGSTTNRTKIEAESGKAEAFFSQETEPAPDVGELPLPPRTEPNPRGAGVPIAGERGAARPRPNSGRSAAAAAAVGEEGARSGARGGTRAGAQAQGRSGGRGGRQAGARVYIMREADGGQGGSRARRGNVSWDGTEGGGAAAAIRSIKERGGGGGRGRQPPKPKGKLETTGMGGRRRVSPVAVAWPCLRQQTTTTKAASQPDQPRRATWPPATGTAGPSDADTPSSIPASRRPIEVPRVPGTSRQRGVVVVLWAETAPPCWTRTQAGRRA
jgi:hypothetical protein